jgi:recombination protein RecA
MDAPVAQKSADRNGDRGRAVDAAILQIEKQFGRGAIMRLGDRGAIAVDVIPTGSVALDLALGVGGVPRGRITEIYT